MPDSAIGFSPADWLALSLAAVLAAAAYLAKPRLLDPFRRFASQRGRTMLLLFALPIVLRLLLLPKHPVPTPAIYDEFSHLLAADTLLHRRLANPPHALHEFFETFFVLQQPTYSSIYPPGQGLLLAFGRAISGSAWTGVVLATGAFCALCYWMLCAFVPPVWAVFGGLLAVAEFGPLCLWMNCYWGGTLAAIGGCLVFGALPRLRSYWRGETNRWRRNALVLGAGFSIHLLTRQFETAFLAGSILWFAIAAWRQTPRRPAWFFRPALIALAPVLAAAFLVAAQNKAVTGRWTLLPEQLSQYQYGVPTTLTIQPPAAPHISLTPQQALEYRAQALMHGPNPDSVEKFLQRLEYRVRDYRFFFLPPLYVALAAFLFAPRPDYGWVIFTVALFALGTNLFPYLLVHYLAGVTCLFVLVGVSGVRQIVTWQIRGIPVGREIAQMIIVLCGAQFVLWYGLHFLETHFAPSALLQYETWDVINHAATGRRAIVQKELEPFPGKLLVFVHYGPQHIFQEEWVWNAADIDASRVVWARDLGATENRKLIRYYPDRERFYLDPDVARPQITPYREPDAP